jgi:hypothetical protein
MNRLKPDPELRHGFKDEKHLAKVRKLGCCVCKKGEQRKKTEAHHLIGYGLGKKPSDRLVIPLCSNHHNHGPAGIAIHHSVLTDWQDKYKKTQQELWHETNELLGISYGISI